MNEKQYDRGDHEHASHNQTGVAQGFLPFLLYLEEGRCTTDGAQAFPFRGLKSDQCHQCYGQSCLNNPQYSQIVFTSRGENYSKWVETALDLPLEDLDTG